MELRPLLRHVSLLAVLTELTRAVSEIHIYSFLDAERELGMLAHKHGMILS